jgi:NAD-dependent dihydropyrimidine dehydrogenase PreA subunit
MMNPPRKKTAESPYSWLEVDRGKCSRCSLCVEMCPMDVLRMGKEKIPHMRYQDDCWYCDVCVSVCPKKAITLKGLPYLIR